MGDDGAEWRRGGERGWRGSYLPGGGSRSRRWAVTKTRCRSTFPFHRSARSYAIGRASEWVRCGSASASECARKLMCVCRGAGNERRSSGDVVGVTVGGGVDGLGSAVADDNDGCWMAFLGPTYFVGGDQDKAQALLLLGFTTTAARPWSMQRAKRKTDAGGGYPGREAAACHGSLSVTKAPSSPMFHLRSAPWTVHSSECQPSASICSSMRGAASLCELQRRTSSQPVL